MKAIFTLPCAYLGIIFRLFSMAPILLSIPINLIIMYGGYKVSAALLTPPNLRKQGVHKTPYLAGIFFGSAFLTILHCKESGLVLSAIG
jgi:hypothetical protein